MDWMAPVRWLIRFLQNIKYLELALVGLSVFGAHLVTDLFLSDGLFDRESKIVGAASILLLISAWVIAAIRRRGEQWKLFLLAFIVSIGLMIWLGAPLVFYAFPATLVVASIHLYMRGETTDG